MRRIFLDLEMNTISKDFEAERQICTQETIEFGAVCLDENNNECDRFQSFVRPEYNKGITKTITKITGIETDQVKSADTFSEVLERFVDWCGTDYEIYSWSDSDPDQLQREMELKGVKVSPRILYMFMHWKDLQKVFDDMFFCERQIGLKSAVWNAGLSFQGRAHSALVDAAATADIFCEMKEGRPLKEISDMLADARQPLTTSLGELLGGIALQSV